MYVMKQRILHAKARRGKKRRISGKNFWWEVRVWEFFVFFLGFASVEKLGFDGKNILFFDEAVFCFFVFFSRLLGWKDTEDLKYYIIDIYTWASGQEGTTYWLC